MAISFGGMAQAIINTLMGGALSNPVQGYYASGPLTNRNEAGVSFTDDRAMQITAVYACVKIITQTVSTLPLFMYEKTPTGRELVTDHPVNDLFRVSPNNLMTPLDFRQAMTAQLCLYGNAYAFIERNRGRITAITPARVGCMTPVRIGNEVWYDYQTSEGLKRFSADNILHLKGFGTDGIIGLSPLRYGAQAFGVTVATEQHAAHSFSSGGRPSGVLTTDRILSDVQRNQIKNIYEDVASSDGLYVLEGGTKYQAISIPPDDLQMLQSRQFQLGEIARMFGVPSFLINDTEKSTTWGSGLEQANLGFLVYGLRAYLVQWEAAVNSALLTRSEQKKYYLEHSLEGLLRGDSAARAAYYSQAIQNGWLTRNEVRSLDNFPRIEGADELTAQVNMAPLDKLGDKQESPDVGIQEQPV